LYTTKQSAGENAERQTTKEKKGRERERERERKGSEDLRKEFGLI
jgi:hypothetical protein